MPRCLRPTLLLALALLAPVFLLAAETITVDFSVSRLLTDDGTLLLIVGKMDNGAEGKWKLKLPDDPGLRIEKGSKGRLTGDRSVLLSSGKVSVRFKGSDEELQALVDWLLE